jgi:hypothetical protein
MRDAIPSALDLRLFELSDDARMRAVCSLSSGCISSMGIESTYSEYRMYDSKRRRLTCAVDTRRAKFAGSSESKSRQRRCTLSAASAPAPLADADADAEDASCTRN